MMDQPEASVSIITPCYNGAKFLGVTLQSALAQTRPPVEILVVDDGSTDNSGQIAEAFGSPVRVIRQANQGESVARNRALSEARGSHVLFLDADDLLGPESLARLSDILDGTENCVGVMGCAWFEDDPSHPYQQTLVDADTFYPSVIESNLMPCHCWLAPIDLVRRAGAFAGTLKWFEDWDMWWRVGLQGATIAKTDYYGALYRRHRDSQLTSSSTADRARGHVMIMARMVEAFLEKPEWLTRYGDQLFWSAWTALSRARTAGVPWSELRLLSDGVKALAANAPATVTRSRTARLVRAFGTRTAHSISGRQ